jgi:hypothetical protein
MFVLAMLQSQLRNLYCSHYVYLTPHFKTYTKGNPKIQKKKDINMHCNMIRKQLKVIQMSNLTHISLSQSSTGIQYHQGYHPKEKGGEMKKQVYDLRRATVFPSNFTSFKLKVYSLSTDRYLERNH